MNTNLLKDLCLALSPSGSEKPATEVWDSYCSKIKGASKFYQDKIGNSGWKLGNGPIEVMLSGHIDEVQARVQGISEDGMITIISTGGIDAKALLSSSVLLLGDNGVVKGFIGKKPIHLDWEDKGEIKLENFRVDIGVSSKEEVEEMGIRVGTIVVYDRRWEEIGKDQDIIVATGLDDKAGVFISYEILNRLSTWEDKSWMDKYTVIAVSMTQEETGCRGAGIAAHNINPDISIDFDVTFCNDGGLGINGGKTGDVKLGKGGVIDYGPDKSERINKLLRETPFSHQAISGRAGGTNTHAIQDEALDCETTIMSIPNRNMHTSVEMVSKKDIESIVNSVFRVIIDQNL